MKHRPHSRLIRRLTLIAALAATVAATPVIADEAATESIPAQGQQALHRLAGELRDASQWQDAGLQRLRELLKGAQTPDEQIFFADQGERG